MAEINPMVKHFTKNLKICLSKNKCSMTAAGKIFGMDNEEVEKDLRALNFVPAELNFRKGLRKLHIEENMRDSLVLDYFSITGVKLYDVKGMTNKSEETEIPSEPQKLVVAGITQAINDAASENDSEATKVSVEPSEKKIDVENFEKAYRYIQSIGKDKGLSINQISLSTGKSKSWLSVYKVGKAAFTTEIFDSVIKILDLAPGDARYNTLVNLVYDTIKSESEKDKFLNKFINDSDSVEEVQKKVISANEVPDADFIAPEELLEKKKAFAAKVFMMAFEKNLTRLELARQIDMSESDLIKIKNGTMSFDMFQIRRLCTILSLRPGEADEFMKEGQECLETIEIPEKVKRYLTNSTIKINALLRSAEVNLPDRYWSELYQEAVEYSRIR